MAKIKDEFTRDWIIENSLNIIPNYDYGVLTLRALHYQLVALGMTNTIQHYKRVVGAMKKARKNGLVPYETFSDHDREQVGYTNSSLTDIDVSIEMGKEQVEAWMNNYRKNKWENQKNYIEVWIEKKALQGVFAPVCRREEVGLCPCKGYPSLTFLHEAAERFKMEMENDKEVVLLYFGDYDATGEDIPRSIADNFYMLFGLKIKIKRIALMKQQVLDWNLPPAPTKKTDSRAKNWDGLGQVELDAVAPDKLQKMLKNAVKDFFDVSAYAKLKLEEEEEREQYVRELKNFVTNL
jgi:hypothetical protein